MTGPAVVVRSLSHAYAGRPALADVSFAVDPGECVAVLGPNGAGKTTLFLRLCGVLRGGTGQATVVGLDPAEASHKSKLPAAVGVVFQQPDDQLFSPTVLDDVAFGPLNLGATPDEARELADEALARVGLVGVADRPPFHLSGGEKRRAALAGVIAMRPAVLLLDEPTAFLDPRGRRELVALLRDLPGTKLVATHDLDVAVALCPRALVLAAGRLLADAPTAAVLADPRRETAFGL